MILYLHGLVVGAGVTRVYVNILKGGYWTRSRNGVFAGFTKSGKVRVAFYDDEVRAYDARNVRVRFN